MEKSWVCQVRPGNPYGGGHLGPEDFFRLERCVHVIFEEGIDVEMFAPHSRTIIVKNNYFCVVKEPWTPHMKTSRTVLGKKRSYPAYEPAIFMVCLPKNVRGRKVVFISPTTPAVERQKLSLE